MAQNGAASAAPGGELSAAAAGAGCAFATLKADTFPKEFPDKHSMKAAVDALQLGQNKEVRGAASLRWSDTQMPRPRVEGLGKGV